MKNMIEENAMAAEVTNETPQENEYLKRLVPKHDKKSREVTEKDVDKVIEEAKVLYGLCFSANGLYKGAYAMAHPQIENKDPLRLFVTADRRIVINPVIIKHSNYTVDSQEACMTFPDMGLITVPRWQKCEVEFVTIMVDPDDKDKFKLSSVQHDSLSGFNSFVWQHESDHLEAKYIY